MDIYEACKTGNMEWLIEQQEAGTLGDLMTPIYVKTGDEDGYDAYPHTLAVENGHIPVVKWLVIESGHQVDLTVDNNSAVRWAAKFGQLDMIKWLVNESGQHVDVTARDNWAVGVAAQNGHLDVVKWLVKESGQQVDVTVDDNFAVGAAAQNGHLDVVRWLTKELLNGPR